jgi:hypothetical protein
MHDNAVQSVVSDKLSACRGATTKQGLSDLVREVQSNDTKLEN